MRLSLARQDDVFGRRMLFVTHLATRSAANLSGLGPKPAAIRRCTNDLMLPYCPLSIPSLGVSEGARGFALWLLSDMAWGILAQASTAADAGGDAVRGARLRAVQDDVVGARGHGPRRARGGAPARRLRPPNTAGAHVQHAAASVLQYSSSCNLHDTAARHNLLMRLFRRLAVTPGSRRAFLWPRRDLPAQHSGNRNMSLARRRQCGAQGPPAQPSHPCRGAPVQVVDCTDGNRFREIKPGDFFRGYSNQAYLPVFADADDAPDAGDGGGDGDSEVLPQRAVSRRLAAKAVNHAGLVSDASATAGHGHADVAKDAGSQRGRAGGWGSTAVDPVAQRCAGGATDSSAAGIAGASALLRDGNSAQRNSSTLPEPRDPDSQHVATNSQQLADAGAVSQAAAACPAAGTVSRVWGQAVNSSLQSAAARVVSNIVPVGCMALHAGIPETQSEASADQYRQASRPGLHLGSKEETASEGAAAAGVDISTVQVPPDRLHENAVQPPSPAQSGEAVQQPPSPGRLTAAAHPVSARRRRPDGGNLTHSPGYSPAPRRRRECGSSQQRHMLKLKDFPPAAEFSRLMARHNQVRRSPSCAI